jgi:HEAT repeat protein
LIDRTDGAPQSRVTEEDIQALINALVSAEKRVAESAHLSLLALGQPTLQPLVAAMHSKDARLRWYAAHTVATMRNPLAAPVLVEELTNPDLDVRWLAAEGLIALGQDGLPDLLRAMIKRPTATRLLQGGQHVIRDLVRGRVHPGEEKYVAIHDLSYALKEKLIPVLQALEEAEPVLRLPAVAQAALDYLRST